MKIRSVPIAVLRFPIAALLIVLAAMPFLLTTIPPLTDIPGHIGQFSVQTAPAGDGLWRYFAFHWSLTLNLASDLIVQMAHPILGVVPTMWLLCAATPALTVAGIIAIARVTNRRGAYALPWALLFVFNSSFLWGFLNFTLTAAFALLAFAGWIALDRRRRLRAAIFLAIIPMLLVGHGVAGVIAIGSIVAYTAGDRPFVRSDLWRATIAPILAATWPPLLAAMLTLTVWKAFGASDGGVTMWLFHRKIGAIVKMLRDQNKILDIASVVGCIVVWLFGRRWGARLRRGPAAAVLSVLVLFVATPSLISGSDEIDTRLAPFIPMLAFAMQDWSGVDPRRRRAVLFAGFALLAVRFGVTTVSFAGYDRRYGMELAALDHVRPGARVVNLTEIDCHGWRSPRLEHLGNLATTFRGAWVNSHWDVNGLQLLTVKYRPSPDYYNDPSEMVFPPECVDPTIRPYAAYRASQTALKAVGELPYERIDYVWLVGAHLPATYRNAALRRIWNDDISELYAVRHPRPAS